MPTVVPWITTADKVVGQGHATLPDVANRPLRQIISSSGIDEVTDGFTGFVPVNNVKAYGATGDGTTDDRAAIQAACDALIGKSGTVYFPRGRYYCATAVILDSRHQGISFKGAAFGAGAVPFAASTLIGDAIILKTATSGAYQPGPSNPLTGFTIEKLGFSPRGGTHDHLVTLTGMVKLMMHDAVFSGGTTGKDNIQLDSFIDVTMTNVQHQGSGRYGLNTMTGACTTLRLRGGYWKNCRDAGLWCVNNSQMSHVIIDGTVFESNGRDGSGAVIAGAVGAGCVFDNVDNLVVNAYFEANVRGDCVVGGSLSSAGVVTRGTGCRGAWVNGYFQGASGGVSATVVGLYLIAVQGITYGGYFSGHSQALVRIDYTRGPAQLDVYDAECRGFNWASAPAAIVRDDGNRILVGTDPNGFVIGDVRSTGALIAASLAISTTATFAGTATFSGSTSAIFANPATFAAAPVFTAVDNKFDRTAAANGATSRTQLHQWGADGVLGPLNLSVQGFPSATGAARYVELAIADSLANRALKVTAASVAVSGKFGANGVTPPTAPTLPANATDLATAMALANALKAAMQGNGTAV